MMTTIPSDPINTITVPNFEPGPWYTGNFVYAYGETWNNGKTYDLNAQLENTKDPDRCAVRLYRYHNPSATILWCGPFSPMIYEYSPDSNSY